MIPSVPNTRMPSAIPIGANRIATIVCANRFILVASPVEPDNVNDRRAAVIDLQAEKAAQPAAPCASYCYHAVGTLSLRIVLHRDRRKKRNAVPANIKSPEDGSGIAVLVPITIPPRSYATALSRICNSPF